MTAWVTILVLILANALYVSAEYAAVGARRSRMRRLGADGNRRATRLLQYIESPAGLVRYVSASQIGITLGSLMLGAYAQAVFGGPVGRLLASWVHLAPDTARSVAEVSILTGLTGAQLVLGELVPKALALQYPTETALLTVQPMLWSLAFFRPFAAVLNAAANLLLRLFRSNLSGHRHIHSPDEIDLLIAESRNGGLLEADEQERLHRALRLGLRSARELMVPRDRLTMLPVDTSWEDVLRTVSASPFSRIPVYRGTADHIIGTLRVKDLVARYIAEGPVPLERLIRPVARLRADLPADRVVSLLRERRVHQAVVVDTPGRAIGLITIQDVLNELLGAGVKA